MSEWLKEHAWKACVPKGTEGSNPSPSALNRMRPKGAHSVHVRRRRDSRQLKHRVRGVRYAAEADYPSPSASIRGPAKVRGFFSI